MTITSTINCGSCNKPLPSTGFFCGSCLAQFKCKSCGSNLEKDHVGCINCGTPKETSGNQSITQTINTFRLHETHGERTIEAAFSNDVAKDLTNMFKDTYVLKVSNQQTENYSQLPIDNKMNNSSPDTSHNSDFLNSAQHENRPISNNANKQSTNYPTLKAIAMKNLPSSETEWIVVYAFYASNFGEGTFTRQDLLNKYKESTRYSENKRKGLSAYLKLAVTANYLNPLESDFSILEAGVEKAKEIISRTSGAAPKIKNVSKNKKDKEGGDKKQNTKKSSNSSNGPKRLTDLDLYPTGKESLESFYKKYTVKNDYENTLLFVYYLQEVLNTTSITYDHLYTCYDSLDIRIPESIKKSVDNTKERKGWVESKGKGNLVLTTAGKNKFKFWDKN